MTSNIKTRNALGSKLSIPVFYLRTQNIWFQYLTLIQQRHFLYGNCTFAASIAHVFGAGWELVVTCSQCVTACSCGTLQSARLGSIAAVLRMLLAPELTSEVAPCIVEPHVRCICCRSVALSSMLEVVWSSEPGAQTCDYTTVDYKAFGEHCEHGCLCQQSCLKNRLFAHKDSTAAFY